MTFNTVCLATLDNRQHDHRHWLMNFDTDCVMTFDTECLVSFDIDCLMTFDIDCLTFVTDWWAAFCAASRH